MSTPEIAYQANPQDYQPIESPDWRIFEKVDDIVNRTYLAELENKPVVPCPRELLQREVSESVCFFPVERFVYDKEENVYQKLTSVYASAAAAGINVAFLVRSVPNEGIELYLGACDEANRENCALPKTQMLYNSFVGNFPGCHVSKDRAILGTERTNAIVNQSFCSAEYHSVAAVSVISSLRGKDRDEKNEAYYQGLEKAIEAMEGKAYTILILAKAVDRKDVLRMEGDLRTLYTELAPFAKTSLSLNMSSSDAVSKTLTDSLSENVSSSITHSLGVGISHSASTTEGEFTADGLSLGASVGKEIFSLTPGYGRTKGHNTGTGTTTGNSAQVNDGKSDSIGRTTTLTLADGQTLTFTSGSAVQMSYENKHVTDILAEIDLQLKRLKTGSGLGMFAVSAYFLGPTALDVRIGASAYKAVMSGDNTHLENAGIHVWTGEKFTQVRSYLSQLCHPVLEIDKKGDPVKVTPAVLVSAPELALQMSMPRHSLVNIPVRESVSFGRSVTTMDLTGRKKVPIPLGKVCHLGYVSQTPVDLDMQSLAMHTFVTGTTGSGKSNTVYCLLDTMLQKHPGVKFMVIEPAKGEYKAVFGQRKNVAVYGTNPFITRLLRINPFRFPDRIHVLEHIDRLLSIFNVCWPMEAAMPAVLKQAIERAYTEAGWDLRRSRNTISPSLYPDFQDVMNAVYQIMDETEFSGENKGDYKGALCTRLQELTTGLNGMMFVPDDLTDEQLFEQNVIVDLSMIGSLETKALIMGLMVIRLQEYRQSHAAVMNSGLRHITVLEEAHHLLKRTSTQQSMDSANMLGRSVELLSNAFAETRTYGEAFIIADQSPGQIDMSVIRNTNTKIVMRLPDYEDCKVMGRAMGLNEIQTAELAKLPTGVAAVYQNDWMEAVLAKIPRFAQPEQTYRNQPEPDDRIFYNADEQSLLNAIFYKNGIETMVNHLKGEKIDAISRLELPTRVKLQLIHYIEQTDVEEIDRLGQLVYELFNMQEAFDLASVDSIESWRNDMLEYLRPSLESIDARDKDMLLLLLSSEFAVRHPEFGQSYLKISEYLSERLNMQEMS